MGEQSWKRSAVETAVIQAISDDGEALQLHMQQEPDDLVMRAKAEFLNAMVPLVAIQCFQDVFSKVHDSLAECYLVAEEACFNACYFSRIHVNLCATQAM